jgi:hypothetical protein
MTQAPGSANMARACHLLSSGIGGTFQLADQGDPPPSRVSSHTFVCGGSNVMVLDFAKIGG